MGEGRARCGPARRVEEAAEGAQNCANSGWEDSGRQSGGKEVDCEEEKEGAVENILIMRMGVRRGREPAAAGMPEGASDRQVRSRPRGLRGAVRFAVSKRSAARRLA